MIIFFFLLIMTAGCTQRQVKTEFDQFWKRSRFIVSDLAEIQGRYEFGYGFEGQIWTLRRDGSFQYEHWADVITPTPVKAVRGSYYSSNDTLVFVFNSYLFFEDSPKERIHSFQSSIESKIRLIKLSDKYSPSFVSQVGNDLFIFNHGQIEKMRSDTSQISKMTETIFVANKKVSLRSLIRVSENSTPR